MILYSTYIRYVNPSTQMPTRSSSNVVDDLRLALTTYAEVVTVLKRRFDDFSKNNSRSTEALAKELLTEKTRNHKVKQGIRPRPLRSTSRAIGEEGAFFTTVYMLA